MAEINQAISSSIMTEHEVDPSHFMPITLEDLDERQRQRHGAAYEDNTRGGVGENVHQDPSRSGSLARSSSQTRLS